MSQIILALHPNDETRFKVGWEHIPCGVYWQERDADDNVTRWSGGARCTIPRLADAVPAEYAPLITEQVRVLLRQHAEDPESGWTSVNLGWTSVNPAPTP